MKYNKIRKMDISDGPGVRVSIFMQGCAFNCKNCFNPETHDFNGGKEFTDDTIKRVMELCENENVEGLSILGGEPMHPKNIEGTTKLAKTFKEKFPNKNLWAWTGFQFDKDLKDKEVLKYIDVLVDGQYADDNSKLKKAAAGEAQDTGSMSISAVVSKRDRGKKYTDRADITREKTISAVWIIRKQCSGTQEKINYRKARAVCRGFVL